MNVIRTGGYIINLNLVRTMGRYSSNFTNKKFIQIKWNGTASSGTFIYHEPDDLVEKIYQESEPELYEKLSKFIDGTE